MDYAAAADGSPNPEDWPLKARPVDDDVTKCSRNGKNALAAAAKFCLDMEQRFMSEWEDEPVPNVKRLSQKIQERACFIMCVGREFSEPAAASLVCIAGEAALACELLQRGAEATDHEINLCNIIRQCALSLMYVDGPDSAAAATAMVGVAKEARRMCGWMERVDELYDYGSYALSHDVGMCDTIRLATTDVMEYILSSSRGSKYVIKNFRKRSNRGESQKTMAGTSNSQKCILEREMKSDALAIDHRTVWANQDLLKKHSKELADVTRDSEAEKPQNPDIQQHLSEEKDKDPALLEETSVIACIVHEVSARAENQIKITLTLPNRLGKLLATSLIILFLTIVTLLSYFWISWM